MGDFVEFVRKDGGVDGRDAGLREQANDGGSGEIGLQPLGAAVADGKDDGAGRGRKRRWHVFQSTGFGVGTSGAARVRQRIQLHSIKGVLYPASDGKAV
jgi:hypothetical protein